MSVVTARSVLITASTLTEPNLVWGISGLINLGLLGYYAVGAYATALISLRLGLPVPLAILLSAGVAAAFGALTFLVIARLREEYLAIVTLSFAEALRVIAENAIPLTNGTDGISQIPRPVTGVSFSQFELIYLGIMIVVVALVAFGLERLRKAPLGRVLRALREDPTVAEAAGKGIMRTQIQCFALGAGIMGLAGALYSHYISYVSPDIFQLQTLVYIFLAVVLGGKGNNKGALVGTLLVIVILEGTRFIADSMSILTAVQSGALRTIVIGMLFIAVLQLRPRGLFPEPRAIFQPPKV